VRQEARQRHFELRIGEEEDALALQPRAQPASTCCARSRGAASVACTRWRRARRPAPPPAASAVVPSAPKGNGALISCAPRDCSARAVSARKGCASSSCVAGPTAGMLPLRRAGRKRTSAQAHLPEQPRELVLHRVGQRAGHQQRRPRGAASPAAAAPAQPGRRLRPA
jgi:hypothetical protein